MPDREKVIKTLTDALTAKENYPWARAEMSFEFIEMLLELLKEQDPVEPELEGGGSTWWHVCGECHGAIDNWDNYCKHCGRRIKHEKKAE